MFLIFTVGHMQTSKEIAWGQYVPQRIGKIADILDGDKIMKTGFA
jgi:hypothetical protein